MTAHFHAYKYYNVRARKYLLRKRKDVTEGEIAQKFADSDSNERLHEVDAQDTEGNGDGAAQNGHPCQQTHPRTVSAYLVFALRQLLLLHMEEAINPSLVAETSHAVVEESSEHIAQRSHQYERPKLQPTDIECRKHHLRTERQKTASQKGGYAHAGVAVLHEESGDAQV